MKDQIIAAVLGGVIALTGYHFIVRPPEHQPQRYQISALSTDSAEICAAERLFCKWRLDTTTGVAAFCIFGSRESVSNCFPMEETTLEKFLAERAAAKAATKQGLEIEENPFADLIPKKE